jgi:pSer/pThr/pTyr-binding forkhead associated (FHA) protein
MDNIVIQISDQIVIFKRQHTVQLPKDFMLRVELIVLVQMDEIVIKIKDKNVIQLTIMHGATFLMIHKAAFHKMESIALT